VIGCELVESSSRRFLETEGKGNNIIYYLRS